MPQSRPTTARCYTPFCSCLRVCVFITAVPIKSSPGLFLLWDQPNHGGSGAPRDCWNKLRMHRREACVCRAAQVRTVPMLRERAGRPLRCPARSRNLVKSLNFVSVRTIKGRSSSAAVLQAVRVACSKQSRFLPRAQGLGPPCAQGVEVLTDFVSCVQGALGHAAAVLRAAEAIGHTHSKYYLIARGRGAQKQREKILGQEGDSETALSCLCIY